MRRAEKNVEIGAGALDQFLVGPRVARPAEVKVDVRRDARAGRRAPAVLVRRARPVSRSEVTEQLRFELVRLRAVDAADVRRRADRLAPELFDDFFLPVEKTLVVEKVVPIQHLDHFLQLVARKDLQKMVEM